jgi:DNA-binding NarL/FixJ family response regulator
VKKAFYGDDLSVQEHQVLWGMAKGKTNEEISKKLYLSIHTVKTYIASLYRKLGVDNRVSAVIKGIQEEILPCPCPNRHSQERR